MGKLRPVEFGIGTKKLAKVTVRGVVQGVGFRPFVYRLAHKHGLTGWVRNTSESVEIEAEGEEWRLCAFVEELRSKVPPMASIETLEVSLSEPQGYTAFEIRGSKTKEGKYQLVSPDIATCRDCLREIFDPQDRRYRYPFTNCTNCGPRFTIIEDIPYDRPRTTMKKFKMCPQCQEEYENPLDRRFHAQPNACPRCGPSLELVTSKGAPVASDDVISTAARILKEGRILAIKGLGGFHLACDATNSEAVSLLRERKHRPAKPLAVMMSMLEEIKEHCVVLPKEERLLLSPQCPIVLLKWKKEESSVCEEVAPALKYLGVMLPYTPLHHLLLREAGIPLVMTSGNISEEPIAKDNDEALHRLGHIADYFLLHNRDIYAKYDDSVTFVEEGTRLIRRARGYAPYPIILPFKAKQVLACGAELKNTFCLTREQHAFLSQHIGDLENEETLEHFERTVELYQKLFRIRPEVIAYDLHPEYLSTKYALSLKSQGDYRLVAVQHHHAHIVSCLAENGTDGPVIGVALDGTGYGSDGAIWGGEFLLADYRGFERLGHLEYVPLPGGEAAIRKPYRMALSYLFHSLGQEVSLEGLPLLSQLSPAEVEVVRLQVQRGINSPPTSSMGRLFDAVSALIGVRGVMDYEAQAAVELEMLAPDGAEGMELEPYPFSIVEEDGCRVVRLGELIRAVVQEIRSGVPSSLISARFHRTVAELILQLCRLISRDTGVKQVALSGGVFQNRLLFRLSTRLLKQAGFEVLTHRAVPCNDGGVSLGQAVVANFKQED